MNKIGPKGYLRPGINITHAARDAFGTGQAKLLDDIESAMSDERASPARTAINLRRQLSDVAGLMRASVSDGKKFEALKDVAEALRRQLVLEEEAERDEIRDVSKLHVVHQGAHANPKGAGSAPVFETPDGLQVKGYRHGENLGRATASTQEGGIGQLVRAVATGNTQGLSQPLLKTMSAGTGATGGFLIPEQLSTQIVDLARNKARVIEAGAITVPMPNGTLTFARVVRDPTPAWRGEHETFATTGPEFGQVSLRSRMVGAVCKLSLELVTYAANIDQLVSQTLTTALALEIDRVAIRGSGVGAEPTGIVTAGISTQAVNAALSSYAPFSRAYGQLLGANVDPNSIALLYNTDVATALDLLVDSQGQPLRPPPSWASMRPLVTNQIPTDTAPNPDMTYAVMGDFSNVVLGVGQGIMLEVSREAGDAGGSAFMQGQVWVRAYAMVDVAVLRSDHFVQLSGIQVA